ncbi:hypothetical protein TNCV_1794331 [Trichonephila clavipes]|nr:hypothetical protein TNCV_1794331 [Trichonephila clavipes]
MVYVAISRVMAQEGLHIQGHGSRRNSYLGSWLKKDFISRVMAQGLHIQGHGSRRTSYPGSWLKKDFILSLLMGVNVFTSVDETMKRFFHYEISLARFLPFILLQLIKL